MVMFMFFIRFIVFLIWIRSGRAQTNDCQLVNVHDPHIDIALLYDQSYSMGRYKNNDTMWNAMKDWITKYFQGSQKNETRFAVMGCGNVQANGDVNPILYLDGKSTGLQGQKLVDKIIAAHNQARYEQNERYYDNVDGCSRSAADKIFQITNGDRQDAKNVVFYVSDCEAHENNDSHKREMPKLLAVSVAFLFVCFEDQEAICKRGNCQRINNIMSWVKNNDLIFQFSTKDALVERLNKVLPTKDTRVCNCRESGFGATGCMRAPDGSCQNTSYPIVVVHPDPPQFARPCTGNVTISCPEIECSCEKLQWKQVKCCDGQETLDRDVSSMPTCEKISVIPNPQCSTPCAADTGSARRRPPITRTKLKFKAQQTATTFPSFAETSKKHPTTTETKTELPREQTYGIDELNKVGERKFEATEATDTTLFIALGVAATALVSLLLLLIVVLLVRQRRRKKRAIIGIKREDEQKHRQKNKRQKPSKHVTNTGDKYKGRLGLEKRKNEKDKRLKVNIIGKVDELGMDKMQKEKDKRLNVNLAANAGRPIGVEKKRKEKDKHLKVNLTTKPRKQS